jgi:hypothetical protein
MKLEDKKSKHASSNEEKSKHAGLAQQNGFGPAFFSNKIVLTQHFFQTLLCGW